MVAATAVHTASAETTTATAALKTVSTPTVVAPPKAVATSSMTATSVPPPHGRRHRGHRHLRDHLRHLAPSTSVAPSAAMAVTLRQWCHQSECA